VIGAGSVVAVVGCVVPNWSQRWIFIWVGKQRRNLIRSSPIETNGFSCSLLFCVVGDNLYSSRKTTGPFCICIYIYTYPTSVAAFDVIIFEGIFFFYFNYLITQMDLTLPFEGRLLTLY